MVTPVRAVLFPVGRARAAGSSPERLHKILTGTAETLQAACKLADRVSRATVTRIPVDLTSLELHPTGPSTRVGRLQEFFDLEITHVEA
jgi:hypothetical protein